MKNYFNNFLLIAIMELEKKGKFYSYLNKINYYI